MEENELNGSDEQAMRKKDEPFPRDGIADSAGKNVLGRAGGSRATVELNEADGEVTSLVLHESQPTFGEQKLDSSAGTASVSLEGGDRVQPSPGGVRRTLIERISELRQGHAEQIADMVLGRGGA